MDKSVLLFDLDGTLTDPEEGIINSVIYALKSLGIKDYDRSSLTDFIGPPLLESFQKYFGFSAPKAEKAVGKYREYFAEKGIFENAIYDGIRELLINQKLKKRKIVLATSKPLVYAKRILEHFEIASYFDFLSGSELDGRRTDKAEVIAYATENLQGFEKKDMVMIGDRKHDIIGARKNSIESIGVLYGYGDEKELTESGADFIIKSVSELSGLLDN